MALSEQSRNWQKANEARKIFHGGILHFADDLITDIHDRLVRPKIGNVETEGDVIVQCDRDVTKRCTCKKTCCQTIYDGVIDLHVCTLHARIPNWHRCFCYDKLAVAACFLTLHEPHERKNKHLQTLNEVDSLGLLTILDNCSMESEKYIDRSLLAQAIEIHTSISKNANLETKRETLLEFLDILVDILRKLDPGRYPSTTGAIKNIQQLKMEDLTLVKLTEGKYYDPTKELGRGRFAVVYEGRSGCAGAMFPSAVKQILCKGQDKSIMRDLTEARIMQVLEMKKGNPNVVGYYELFQNETHLYIFTELYNGTLEDYVKVCYRQLRSSFSATAVNRCLAEGLRFLHAEGVVHRDLKPSNIFIGLDENGTKITKVAIGDFGSAKLCRMQFEHSASLSCLSAPGTAGYVAPEVWAWYQNDDDIEEDEKKYFTVKSDTYSLGLIFYFTISNGKHPFGKGNGFRIQHRIQEGEKPNLVEASEEYQLLIRQMIKTEITERMFADNVLNHPALWTSEQILNFLKTKSNYLADSKSPMVGKLKHELDSSEIVRSRGWIAELPLALKERLCKGRHSFRGKEHSMTALLRAIRNTEHHIDSYPELAGGPDQRVSIWTSACPGLTMRVYDVFKDFDHKDLTDSQILNQAPIDTDVEHTEVLTVYDRSHYAQDNEQTAGQNVVEQTPGKTDTEQTEVLKVVKEAPILKNIDHTEAVKAVKQAPIDKYIEHTDVVKAIKQAPIDIDTEHKEVEKMFKQAPIDKDIQHTEVVDKEVNQASIDKNIAHTEMEKVVNQPLSDDKDSKQT